MNNVCKELELKMILCPPTYITTYYALHDAGSNTCPCTKCILDPITIDVYWNNTDKYERFTIRRSLINHKRDNLFKLRSRSPL